MRERPRLQAFALSFLLFALILIPLVWEIRGLRQERVRLLTEVSEAKERILRLETQPVPPVPESPPKPAPDPPHAPTQAPLQAAAPPAAPPEDRPLSESLVLGVNLCDWNDRWGTEESRQAIKEMKAFGTRRVVFVPHIFQLDTNSITLYEIPGKTGSLDRMKMDMHFAHEEGLEVAICVHVDPEEGPRSSIHFVGDAYLAKWFENYLAALKVYADAAAEVRAEEFSVGCELHSLNSDERATPHWAHLIGELRTRFAGFTGAVSGRPVRLGYACVTNRPGDVRFWDLLDYVGVNAWPSFNEETTQTDPEWVKAQWFNASIYTASGFKNFLSEACQVALDCGKPLILTEIGCQSKTGVLSNPGSYSLRGREDEETQAIFYEGTLAALAAHLQIYPFMNHGQASPLKEIYLWNEQIPKTPDSPDYPIRGKRAEQVVKEAFAPGQP